MATATDTTAPTTVDAGDKIAPTRSPTPTLDAGMSMPNFNQQYFESLQRTANTASLTDMSLSGAGRFQIAEAGRPGSAAGSDTGPPAVQFKNLGASAGFSETVQNQFSQTFDRLNPETQEKLKGLKVITAPEVRDGMPGMPRGIPAVTPDLSEGHGNMMVFSERGLKRDGAPVKDVMQHELWHAVDNVTRGSQDKEMRDAIDKGISRLPKEEQRRIAAHNPEQHVRRYAELAGDAMALELGSKPKDLAYVSKVSDPYNNFREARELMRQRYLK
jgi:hypothetical protein